MKSPAQLVYAKTNVKNKIEIVPTFHRAVKIIK
jgi:hypothetical protein